MKALGDLTLFDYQENVLSKASTILNDGKSIIIRMPYGTGKTIIALELIEALQHSIKNFKKKCSFFTSGGDGGSMRVFQAKQIAKEHKYDGCLRSDAAKRYKSAMGAQNQALLKQLKSSKTKTISDQHTFRKLETDFLQVSKLKKVLKELQNSRNAVELWKKIGFIVIDEIDEILIKDFEAFQGFNVSKQFSEVIQLLTSNNIPIVGLTGTKDPKMIKALQYYLKINDDGIVGSDVKDPFDYTSEISLVTNDAFVELLDKKIRFRISNLIQEITSILDIKNLARETTYDLIYNGLQKITAFYYSNPNRERYSLTIRPEGRLSFDRDQVEAIVPIYRELRWILISRIILLNSTASHLFRIVQRRTEVEKEFWKTLEEYFNNKADNWVTLIKGGYQQVITVCNDILDNYFSDFDFFSQIYLLTWLRFKRSEKTPLYGKILKAVPLTKAIINKGEQIILMTRYVKMALELTERIKQFNQDYDIACLTGSNTEKERQDILTRFREGSIQALVLNKIGTKGLDFPNASSIIHVDIDSNAETMRQRTARIRGGKQYLLVYANTMEIFKIRKYIEQSVDDKFKQQFEKIIKTEKVTEKAKFSDI